jgi:DtxR family Mn-dependent transcriptional regulator
MENRKLIHRTGGGLELTPEGERWAIQIVRAHRLWERYLSDEAGVPLQNVHVAAERAEHKLSAEALEALDAHLGHPLHDPHGDPIPQADGTIEDLQATPLTDWKSAGKAHIVHLEDEPALVFKQIVALGLQPGDQIRILEHQPDFIVIAHGDNEHRLAPVLAANIHVQAAALAPPKPADAITLAELPDGREASVVAIDPNFRGFARRRLLDLGLTPETSIRPELGNAFGDPRAYRVRGVLIALREEQAKLVWVRPQEADAA